MNKVKVPFSQPLIDAIDNLNREMEKLAKDAIECRIELMDITTIGDPVQRQILVLRGLYKNMFYGAPIETTE